MADATASFAIDLESNVAGVALESAAALEELRDSIQADTAALGNMNKALRQLQGGAAVDIQTVRQLKAQIAATKATVAQNTQAFVQSGGSFRKLKPAVQEAGTSLKELGTVTKLLPAPLQSIGGKLSGLGGAAGIFAASTVALTVALVALAAAALAAGASLVGFAIATADARRSEELRLQGLSKYRNFWSEMVTGQRRAADSSSFLQQQLDAVAGSSALGRDQLAGMQAELYRAGLRSGNLQAALEGLAVVESAQGKEAADAFKARAIGAALYGTSVKKLSDDVKARLGGIAKAQMLSLDVQTRKLKENVAGLFRDIKIEKLLEGISVIASMFSQSTASGRALKALIDTLLQPLLDSLPGSTLVVKRFFQGLTIAALKFAIGVLVIRNYLRDTFGGSEFLKNMNLTEAAVMAGKVAFGLLATAVIAGVVAFTLLGVAVALVAAPFVIAGIAAYKLVTALVGVYNYIANMSWGELGTLIVRGMVAGLTGGTSELVVAMTNLAGKAMKAFRDKLEIKSPSRVAFRDMMQVTHGAVIALRTGTPNVERGAERMARATSNGMRRGAASNVFDFEQAREARAAGAQGGAARQASAVHVTIAPGAVVIHGVTDPEAAAERAVLLLEEKIVKAAHAMGAM